MAEINILKWQYVRILVENVKKKKQNYQQNVYKLQF